MSVLPEQFADLEPYADWCLPGETERYGKRTASSMEELQAFYDAAYPRLEDMKAYLDELPLDDLPDDATALLQLCYSLVAISFPIEVWRQPRVPDSGASDFPCVAAPPV